MTKQQMQFSISELRQKHPRFIYEKYSWNTENDNLIIHFKFRIEPDIVFNPSLKINAINLPNFQKIDKEVIDNLVFNLGLVEMISYWKATCSAVIEIKPNGLDDQQIIWWKELIIKGLGEFFFVNQIDFLSPNFLTIQANGSASLQGYDSSLKQNDFLVLTSGGKDTALTLSILQNEKIDFGSISLNPTSAALELSAICGSQDSIVIERKIEQKLLELNSLGYLNGHTPFSSYLGFLSIFVGVIFGYKNILVSNERSSNEGNTTFLGKDINHQYTKTLDFEKKFQGYIHQYITSNVKYFSFLRPLYEIQIAAMLTKFDRVVPVFRSCNRNYKENSWCGNCPKCLAVYILIFPFTDNSTIKTIFGKDPFEDGSNIKTVNDLIGLGAHKPFECVGTHEETIVGLFLGLKNAKKQYTDIPTVWKYIDEENILEGFEDLPDKAQGILTDWDTNHALPQEFEKLLKKYQQEILIKSNGVN